MSTIDRYLGGVQVGGRVRMNVRLFLIVLVALAVMCLLMQGAPSRGPFHVAAQMLGGAYLLVVGLASVLVLLRVDDRAQQAQRCLLREDLDRAIALGQQSVSGARDARTRARALLVLGRCAELAGDFGEAAQIFGHGIESLPARRTSQLGDDSHVELALRRAFCLAAMGRLAESERQAAVDLGHRRFYFSAIALRARLLRLVRAGDAAGAKGLLAEHAGNRATGAYRDRVLVRAARAWARATLGEPAAGVPRAVRTDAATRAWVVCAAPALADHLETPDV